MPANVGDLKGAALQDALRAAIEADLASAAYQAAIEAGLAGDDPQDVLLPMTELHVGPNGSCYVTTVSASQHGEEAFKAFVNLGKLEDVPKWDRGIPSARVRHRPLEEEQRFAEACKRLAEVDPAERAALERGRQERTAQVKARRR